jgi:hypothetical protein
MHISKGRALAFGAAVAAGFAAFILTQSVLASRAELPAASNRARTEADALPAKLQAAAQDLGLQLDTSRSIAPNLYLVAGSSAIVGNDQLCILNTAYGLSLGCNPESNFYQGEVLRFGIAEQGPPDAPSDLTLAGIAQPNVASVRMMLPSGPVEAMPTSDGGFAIHADASQLLNGRPTELDALNSSGATIATFELPQG